MMKLLATLALLLWGSLALAVDAAPPETRALVVLGESLNAVPLFTVTPLEPRSSLMR